MTRFGFVGLGEQGGPMARRAVDAGLPVTLYARRHAALHPFSSTVAGVAASLPELAARCDVVAVCVTDDRATEDVVIGLREGLGAGAVVVVHGTVHPETCRRLSSELAESGIALLDAPVSGGGPAAATGRLTVMVGGSRGALERCLPLLRTYADAIFHVGDVGAGQTVKLLNNLAFAAHLTVAHDVLDLGARLGVATAPLLEVLDHASGASTALAIYGRLGSMAALGKAGGLLAKDLSLAEDVAHGAGGIPAPVADAARRTVELVRATTANQP